LGVWGFGVWGVGFLVWDVGFGERLDTATALQASTTTAALAVMAPVTAGDTPHAAHPHDTRGTSSVMPASGFPGFRVIPNSVEGSPGSELRV